MSRIPHPLPLLEESKKGIMLICTKKAYQVENRINKSYKKERNNVCVRTCRTVGVTPTLDYFNYLII